jgi:hypothetical protein
MINFSEQMGEEIPQEEDGEVMNGELAPKVQGEALQLWTSEYFETITAIVSKDFELYRPNLDALMEKARAHHVVDEASDQVAVMIGTSMQGLKGKLEKRCAFIVDEPNAFVTTIRGKKNGFVKDLDAAMDDLAKKRDVFLAVERRRKEALRLQAEKEARELQDRLNREAREKAETEAKKLAEEEAAKWGIPVDQVEIVVQSIEEVVIPMPVVEQPKTTVRSSSGSGTGYQKKRLYIEIVDFSKVDDRYKILRDSVIKDDFKAGVRSFNGLLVEEREKSQFRSK